MSTQAALSVGSFNTRDLMFTKPDLLMPVTGQTITTIIFGLGALATLWYAVMVTRRDRDPYAIWIYLGSVLASTYETYDSTMGHFLYPEGGQVVVYQLLGVKLPLFLIFTYPFYVAALVIWVYERLYTHRLTVSNWWKMFAFALVSAAAFEPPFINAGLWQYYGINQPIELFGLPVWWIVANPAAIMCIGLVCFCVCNILLERQASVVLIIIVPVSLFALHGSISAPIYLALNTSPEKAVTNTAALLTMLLAGGLAWLGAKVVAKNALGAAEAP